MSEIDISQEINNCFVKEIDQNKLLSNKNKKSLYDSKFD